MNESFQNLIADYLDGELTDKQLVEFSDRLATDKKFQQEFVRCTHLHRQLYDALQDKAQGFIDDELKTVLKNPELQPLNFTPAVDQVVLRQPWRAKWNYLVAAIVIVAAGFYGTFALIAWNLRPTTTGLQRAIVAQPMSNAATEFATLTGVNDCRWARNSSDLSIGAPLAHRSLCLLEGAAEITFVQGTRMVLEGPVQITLESGSETYLSEGKIVAHVPKPAIGFTVKTASATVIDLGTEFGVKTDKEGQTDVEVLEGQVELIPNVNSNALGKPSSIKLSAGAARRVEIGRDTKQVTVKEIRHNPERFTRKIKSSPSDRLSIQGVLASSEFGNREARHLIDGSGMHGDAHTDFPEGNMWLSSLGKVSGEFVSFDLGRPYSLRTLKVWNYNENRINADDTQGSNLQQSRGVGQGDIYVSKTGKWDPISYPQDWQLVEADHQFAAADGTPSYSTPEVIALKGVEARYVAIVIDRNQGPDTRPNSSAEENCVGLSEAQIFGDRIVEPKSSVTK